jgi:hypothetical protein
MQLGFLSQSDAESKILLDQLYCVDYKNLQQRPRLAHPGTSSWLYQNPQFSKWIEAKSSAILWMSGMPGMGKSVLARSFVEDAMANSNTVSSTQESVVAHYFCTYVDAAFNNEETVLRSILHQFLQSVPLIFRLLQSTLQIRTQRGLAYPMNRNSLWQSLGEVLALEAFKNVLIVIDAIEELPRASAIQLLEGLHATVSSLMTMFIIMLLRYSLPVVIVRNMLVFFPACPLYAYNEVTSNKASEGT